MAIHIENLEIEQFRGICQLSVPHLSHINLIVGDNNCGKTSFLEALLLLRNPEDFTNTLRIARMRDSLAMYGGISVYESLLTLFPHNRNEAKTAHMISLHARCRGEDVLYLLQGNVKTIMLDMEEQNRIPVYSVRRLRNFKNSVPSECQAFHGNLLVRTGDNQMQNVVSFHEYSTVLGRNISNRHFLNMVYLAPFDHLRGGNFTRILTNESYKELCIQILQLFDPGITDLLLLKNENTNRPIECVKHKDMGTMPLSSYGDGIKKVLSIASGIAKAVNGVLLIDEVETAIHSRYFEDIFRFIASACRKFDVQVFITSHSIEAIDGFLSIADYDKTPEEADPISVVTLKKDRRSFLSYARVLQGRHVRQNREQFGFEVRL